MDTTPLITDVDFDFLRNYILNASPTGNERKGQQLWLDYIGPYVDEHFVDAYGSVAAIVNPGQDFKVVVEAHADEIAWYVQRIDENGFIHVQDTGGADAGIAPSQRVNIHTSKGTVPGVFGWPAIHARDMSVPAPQQNTIFIGCGCESKEEAEALGIQVGDFVTYDAGFLILNHRHFVGRALDNRMGGFILARLARLLREEAIQLPYSLYFVNAVQEEVGTKGAEMMAHSIRPSCALVVDVTHDTASPMMDKDKQGDITMGKGPVITKAPSVHNKFRALLCETAGEGGIPIQRAAMARTTGTDTDAFAYQLGGIPSALLSLPLRYMHTTVETVHRDDVENTIRLLFGALQRLTPDFNFKYL